LGKKKENYLPTEGALSYTVLRERRDIAFKQQKRAGGGDIKRVPGREGLGPETPLDGFHEEGERRS